MLPFLFALTSGGAFGTLSIYKKRTAQTGTTLVHGMGYQLTYYKGISHGRANGLLFPQYMELMEETQPDKVDKVWNLLGLADARDFAALIADLMPDKVKLTESEIKTYVALTMPTNAVKTTAYDVTEQVVADMYRRL